MGDSPSEAGEEGSGDDEDEAESAEVYLASDHHDDADSHGSDDENELYGWRFEAEEEGKGEDEG